MAFEDFEGFDDEEEAISQAFENERDKFRIRSWFIPRSVPDGQAPLITRRAWLDVPLPLKYDRPVESPEPAVGRGILDGTPEYMKDAIIIDASDAIKSLRLFGRIEAAKWWQHLYGDDPIVIMMRHLKFNASEGVLIPPNYASMMLPGVELFDEVEP